MRALVLDDVAAPRQQIMCSRSFGRAVVGLPDLAEAVSVHATRVAEQARRDGSLAGAAHVFIHTSQHRKQDRQYSASRTIPLVRPTADTRLLASAALMDLRAIYRDGYRYEKAGVMLVELQPDTVHQGELDLMNDFRPLSRCRSARWGLQCAGPKHRPDLSACCAVSWLPPPCWSAQESLRPRHESSSRSLR